MNNANGFIGKHLGTLITSIAIMSIAGLVAWGTMMEKVSALQEATNPEEMGKWKEKVERMEKEINSKTFGKLISSMDVLSAALGNHSSDIHDLEEWFFTLNNNVIELRKDIEFLKEKHN